MALPDEEQQSDAGFAFVWVAVAFAVGALIYLRSVVGNKPNVDQQLVIFGAVIGVATIVLVGFQLVLAFEQTIILRKQDEILARREIIDAHLIDHNGSRVDLFSVGQPAEPTMHVQPWSALVRVVLFNRGKRTSHTTWLSLFVPTLDGRALFIRPNDATWHLTTEVREINGVLCKRYETKIPDPIFPSRGLRVDVVFIYTPGDAEFAIYWVAAAENGTYPESGDLGILRLRLHAT